MVDLSATVFRDFETDGVPASGTLKPKKAKIREWGAYLEAGVLGGAAGSAVFASKATMDATLTYSANTMAWVIGDATAANNGIYQKSGASGAGSWLRLGDLPHGFIKAVDAGAGTANAIVATTSLPLPSTAYAALILMNVFEANAGAVTVAINGAAAKPLMTNSGGALAAGYLSAGMLAAFVDDGTNYRLVSDVASAAIQAAAEAAAVEAAASASSVDYRIVTTRTALKALDTTVSTVAILKESGREGTFIWTSGDHSTQIAADTLEGVYLKADGMAATSGAWVRSDFDGVTHDIRWFGVVDDGTDQSAKVQAALDFAAAGTFIDLSISFKITTAISVAKALHIRGRGAKATEIDLGTNSGFVVTPDIGSLGGRLRFSDFTVKDSTLTRTAGTAGISSVNTTLVDGLGYLSVQNVRVVGTQYGIRLEYCQLYNITNCYLSHCANGLYTKRCVNGVASGVIAELNTIWGFNVQGDSGSVTQSAGQLFQQCTAVNNGSASGGNFNVSYNEYTTIQNCMIDTAATGSLFNIQLVGCSRGSIIGNWVGASKGEGIILTSCGHIKIIGNDILTSATYGIALESTSYTTVSGNSLLQNGNTDILLYGGTAGARNNLIVGNQLLSNSSANSVQETAAFNTYFMGGNFHVGAVALQETSINRFNSKSLYEGGPVTKTADFTVGAGENWLAVNKGSSCTVTLPAAASFTGRVLRFVTYDANTVVSASANVVPITGGAAGTAILPAVDGAWCTMISDGTNWRIMESG